MTDTKTSISDLIDTITPELYRTLKNAIETGRWENGIVLTSNQKAHCLQAIIAWEARHLPEQERTGYIPPKKTTTCDHDEDHRPDADSEQPIRFTQ